MPKQGRKKPSDGTFAQDANKLYQHYHKTPSDKSKVPKDELGYVSPYRAKLKMRAQNLVDLPANVRDMQPNLVKAGKDALKRHEAIENKVKDIKINRKRR